MRYQTITYQGHVIEVPDWENGFSEKEYISLLDTLVYAVNIFYNSETDSVTQEIDNIISILPFFSKECYDQNVYSDIIRYSSVPNLERQFVPEHNHLTVSYEYYIAKEQLIRDVQEKILIQNCDFQ